MDKFIEIKKRSSSSINIKPDSNNKRHKFILPTSKKTLIIKNEEVYLSDLTKSQRDAMYLITKGKNIFLTGEAGTGKTFLVNRIKEMSLDQNIKIAITAMTGTAAYLLGGTTLHSWANIGLASGNEPTEQLVKKINKYQKAVRKWQEVDILVIDEISMMSYALLDKLEEVARCFRNPNKIFGGIQVILIGDFFQLPPIPENNQTPEVLFAFKANCWNRLIDENIILQEVIRQSDPIFKNCLSEIRKGYISNITKSILETRVAIPLIDDKIKATRIYPYKQNVEGMNYKKLHKLNRELQEYKLEYKFSKEGREFSSSEVVMNLTHYIKHLPCDEKLTIAIGAQVMLIANLNMEAGLVNGSRGVVKDIDNQTGNISVEFINGEIRNITRHEWKVTLDSGYEVTFSQIPLILAWAITIHKAQGASLDLAEIDVGSTIFEYGQAYVALSRIRNLNGLRLIAFNPRKIRANPDVLAFYKSIEIVN